MPRNTINPEETRTLSCPGFLSKNPASRLYACHATTVHFITTDWH